MTSDGGKGSTQRPTDHEAFSKAFDAIDWGRKVKNLQLPKGEHPESCFEFAGKLAVITNKSVHLMHDLKGNGVFVPMISTSMQQKEEGNAPVSKLPAKDSRSHPLDEKNRK